MKITYTLDDTEWQGVLHRASEQIMATTAQVVDRSSLALQATAIDQAPVGATGLLRQSIQAMTTARLAYTVTGGIQTASPYAAAIEHGTRPHHPPVAPLKMWVKAKFAVVAEDKINQIAWAVARKIARHGTKAQLFMTSATNFIRPQFHAQLRAAIKQLAHHLNR